MNKQNQRFTCLVIFFLVLTVDTYTQRDLKKGYIITSENDTIIGFINLKSNINNSTECEFYKSQDSKPELFTPQNIKEYRIDNYKYYVSKDIKINNQEKKVFLEFLVEGIVNLYFYGDALNDHYFIEKEGALYPLSNNLRDVKGENDVMYQKRSNQYMGVLNQLFKDSPEVSKKVPNTVFAYKPLIKLTEDYHNSVCKDYDCINYTKNSDLKIFLEPHFGITLSRMTIKTSDDYLADQSINFGIYARFSPAKVHYLWNYIIGINYESHSYEGVLKNSLYDDEDYHFIQLDYSMVRIPFIAEYIFPFKKLQPSVYFGYNNIFIINPEYEVMMYDDYTVPSNGTYFNQPKKFRKYQYGFTGGIGLKYHLTDHSFIHINSSYEFRVPSTNANFFFDYHRVSSVYINLGLAFNIN
ncbi:MAG: hypothetical protein JXB49_34860 [Bacteroidales bacterium]|nr:hypothetical protein [Bacteroidales bacterium]